MNGPYIVFAMLTRTLEHDMLQETKKPSDAGFSKELSNLITCDAAEVWLNIATFNLCCHLPITHFSKNNTCLIEMLLDATKKLDVDKVALGTGMGLYLSCSALPFSIIPPAPEAWYRRRKMRIGWVDTVIKEEVCRRTGLKRSVAEQLGTHYNAKETQKH
jgi:hypothetical protein